MAKKVIASVNGKSKPVMASSGQSYPFVLINTNPTPNYKPNVDALLAPYLAQGLAIRSREDGIVVMVKEEAL